MPYIIKNNISHFEEIKIESGSALGMINESLYYNQKINLDDGDMILLFTDGLLELKNENGIQFSNAELHNAIEHNMHLSPKGLVEAILNSADAFADGMYTEDDITIIAFSYNSLMG